MSLKEKIYSKKTLLSFSVAFAILYLLLIKVDLARTLEIMKGVRLRIYLLAIVVFYTAFFLRGLRWSKLLENAGLTTPWRDATEILFVSWFANCLIPAKLGDVYRGYLLKKNYKHSLSKTMGTIFVERAFDIIAIVVLLLLTGFIAFKGGMPITILRSLKVVGALSIFLILILIFVVYQEGFISRFAPKTLREVIERFEEGISQSLRRRSLPIITVYTLVMWLSDALRLFLVTRAIDFPIPISLLIFVSFTGALLTAFPGTPAGLGAVELAIAGLLILMGVTKEVAVSIAILDRLITYWSLLIFTGTAHVLSSKT